MSEDEQSQEKKPEENKKKPRGWALAKYRGPKFGKERSVPLSPGRPRLSDSILEARRLLKEAAPEMVGKIIALSNSPDADIAIKALKVGIDKILPNLEEVDMHDDRPLVQFSEQQLTIKLKELEGDTSHTLGTGTAA